MHKQLISSLLVQQRGWRDAERRVRASSHEPTGSSVTDCAELTGPPGGCCIYALLSSPPVGAALLNSSWRAPLLSSPLLSSPPSFPLSWLFRCRVPNTRGCGATGRSVVISVIALLIISPLSPKESAVGQGAETDKEGPPSPSHCAAGESCLYTSSVCFLKMHLHSGCEI